MHPTQSCWNSGSDPGKELQAASKTPGPASHDHSCATTWTPQLQVEKVSALNTELHLRSPPQAESEGTSGEFVNLGRSPLCGLPGMTRKADMLERSKKLKLREKLAGTEELALLHPSPGCGAYRLTACWPNVNGRGTNQHDVRSPQAVSEVAWKRFRSWSCDALMQTSGRNLVYQPLSARIGVA